MAQTYLRVVHDGVRDDGSESGEHLLAGEALVGVQNQQASDDVLRGLAHHLLSSGVKEINFATTILPHNIFDSTLIVLSLVIYLKNPVTFLSC